MLSIGQGLHIALDVSRQPGYLLLSVVSAKAASMMRSEGGSGEHYLRDTVRQMTTDCRSYVFTTSTVPARGPQGARTFQSRPLSERVILCNSLWMGGLEGHVGDSLRGRGERSHPRSR